jgi:hypothetical protein
MCYSFAIMLKHLAIVGSWLLYAGIMASQGDKNARPNPQPAKQEQPALHAANGKHGQSETSNNQGKTGDNPPAGNASLERTQVWWRDSNWWLVIIAGLTGGFIGWQSWETRKASQAALLNAQAVINAERPWLLMNVERSKDSAAGYIVSAKNCGRTPALIVSASGGGLGVNNHTDLPTVPPYTREKSARSRIVITEESQMIAKVDRAALRIMLGNDEVFEQVMRCEKKAYIFGNVLYRDAVGPVGSPLHETRWICAFVPISDGNDLYPSVDGLYLIEGTDEYARHT